MSDPGAGAQWAQDFFIYSASIGSLAPAATATTNINIQADSNFEWIQATCYGNLNGATAPISDASLLPINITLIDSGSARQLFSAPLPIASFAGNGKQPFILPVTKIFQAKATIQITAQNFMAAGTYDNIFLNFIGRKLFKLQNGY